MHYHDEKKRSAVVYEMHFYKMVDYCFDAPIYEY